MPALRALSYSRYCCELYEEASRIASSRGSKSGPRAVDLLLADKRVHRVKAPLPQHDDDSIKNLTAIVKCYSCAIHEPASEHNMKELGSVLLRDLHSLSCWDRATTFIALFQFGQRPFLKKLVSLYIRIREAVKSVFFFFSRPPQFKRTNIMRDLYTWEQDTMETMEARLCKAERSLSKDSQVLKKTLSHYSWIKIHDAERVIRGQNLSESRLKLMIARWERAISQLPTSPKKRFVPKMPEGKKAPIRNVMLEVKSLDDQEQAALRWTAMYNDLMRKSFLPDKSCDRVAESVFRNLEAKAPTIVAKLWFDYRFLTKRRDLLSLFNEKCREYVRKNTVDSYDPQGGEYRLFASEMLVNLVERLARRYQVCLS
jgi:hypothetical protein